ncbi:protein-tyrosine phosphatase, partial [Dimargaris cristalligena]
MAHLPLIIPPFRFACVEPGVYRGCYPNRLNERFLLRLQLRTIISLAPNDPNSWLPDYCTQHQIARFSFPTDVPKENVTLQTESIQRCLELLLDPRRHPLYLHCTDGTANTSLIIIALRRLQLWPLTAAIAEYLRFS